MNEVTMDKNLNNGNFIVAIGDYKKTKSKGDKQANTVFDFCKKFGLYLNINDFEKWNEPGKPNKNYIVFEEYICIDYMDSNDFEFNNTHDNILNSSYKKFPEIDIENSDFDFPIISYEEFLKIGDYLKQKTKKPKNNW